MPGSRRNLVAAARRRRARQVWWRGQWGRSFTPSRPWSCRGPCGGLTRRGRCAPGRPPHSPSRGLAIGRAVTAPRKEQWVSLARRVPQDARRPSRRSPGQSGTAGALGSPAPRRWHSAWAWLGHRQCARLCCTAWPSGGLGHTASLTAAGRATPVPVAGRGGAEWPVTRGGSLCHHEGRGAIACTAWSHLADTLSERSRRRGPCAVPREADARSRGAGAGPGGQSLSRLVVVPAPMTRLHFVTRETRLHV